MHRSGWSKGLSGGTVQSTGKFGSNSMRIWQLNWFTTVSSTISKGACVGTIGSADAGCNILLITSTHAYQICDYHVGFGPPLWVYMCVIHFREVILTRACKTKIFTHCIYLRVYFYADSLSNVQSKVPSRLCTLDIVASLGLGGRADPHGTHEVATACRDICILTNCL